MHAARDFDLQQELPWQAQDLVQDLELDTLFNAMALGDEYLFQVARTAVLSGVPDPATIVYRQDVLADCLRQPEVIRELFALAGEAIESEKSVFFFWRDSPESLLSRSLRVLELLIVVLKRVRALAEAHAEAFRSEGFTRLFAMLRQELDDAYLQTVENHVKELKFRRGVLFSAELGEGNKGRHYVVRSPRAQAWRDRMPLGNRSTYSFTIASRDENGARALGELRGKSINSLANAVAQSTDHILSFFSILRAELGFYVGCLNLHAQLTRKGEPVCFPEPLAADEQVFVARGLYDACLAFYLDAPVVGNDVAVEGASLVMITGANHGGKSTFLRSVGLAYLMMQCGMFVPAQSLRAAVRVGIFTHFKREEDADMRSGKLDEELSRMSDIVTACTRNSLLLCNESFGSTNEREGSEIARQVVRALVESGVTVFFVTHLFDLADSLFRQGLATAVFLRAERLANGQRTYRLVPGAPQPTSYGEDSYRRVFGDGGVAALVPRTSAGVTGVEGTGAPN